MKVLVLLFVMMTSLSSVAGIKVVYGEDNRKEYYQVNSFYKRLADATAGMVEKGVIQKENDKYRLFTPATHGESSQLCEGEKFTDQPIAPECSGFLIGDDILVTAGHCYLHWSMRFRGYNNQEAVCKAFSWVFGYGYKTQGKLNRKGINPEDVYNCKEIIAAKREGDDDFAIIKLDRKVTGRNAVEIRKDGKVSDNAQLVVIGHPSGLPTKITDGGQILDNNEEALMTTNLDTFHGNSGSAVFNARTGMVEGILVSGMPDFVEIDDGKGGSCNVVNVCDKDGTNCLDGSNEAGQGEQVYRITNINQYL